MIFMYIIFFQKITSLPRLQMMVELCWVKAVLFVFLFLAEDPSKSYVKLRDFVLVKLCQDLPCFSRERLMQGFHEDMAIQAQQKFKINKVFFNFYFVGGKHLFFKVLNYCKDIKMCGKQQWLHRRF